MAGCEGLELEADTIQFVRQYAGEVPVTEVVYDWIDHELNRSGDVEFSNLIAQKIPSVMESKNHWKVPLLNLLQTLTNCFTFITQILDQQIS